MTMPLLGLAVALDAAAGAGLVEVDPDRLLFVLAGQGPVNVLLKDGLGLDGLELCLEAGRVVGEGV